MTIFKTEIVVLAEIAKLVFIAENITTHGD